MQDGVPNSCMNTMVNICVSISKDTDSAIMELIKKLEGEDDEDEEEPKEVATEALEDERTTDR